MVVPRSFARDNRLHRAVAIKVWNRDLTASQQARVRREGKALAALDHDHIVKVHDYGEAATGEPYLVMELVEGEPLNARIKRTGRVEPRYAAQLVADLADALAKAHAEGLVHRDVKPSNILIQEPTGRVKLVDFGLVLDQKTEELLTRENALAGTPEYMSPEQIRDPHLVDHRSDIYSLGVVLYQLLTGERPFQGVVRMMLLQILHDEPPPPRKLDDRIPRELETICLKAIAKEPAERYATAEEMATDLRRWLDHRPIAARRRSQIARLAGWCKRKPLTAALTGGIIGLLTLMGVGGYLVSWQIAIARDEARTERDTSLATLKEMVFQLPDDFDHLRDTDDAFEVAQRDILQSAVNLLDNVTVTDANRNDVAITRFAAHTRLAGSLYDTGNKPAGQRQLVRALQAQQALPAELATNREVLDATSLLRYHQYQILYDQNKLEDAARDSRSHSNWIGSGLPPIPPKWTMCTISSSLR